MFAILLADFLFSKACQLSTEAGGEVLSAVCEAVERACAAQLREVQHAYDLDVTEDEHLAVIAGRTATVFELPCRLGAGLGGLPQPAVTALAAYGHHLGIAFQLAEDALSLAGQQVHLGREAAADLRDGTYSLAVLRTLADPDHRRRLRPLLARDRPSGTAIEKAIDLIRASGGIRYALDTAEVHAARARAALESLPRGPGRATLTRLTHFAVARTVAPAPDLASAFDP
jgi:geranylgeranyl pyrophosphate synthase